MICEKKLSIILISPVLICILIFTFFYTSNTKNLKEKLRTGTVSQKCNKIMKVSTPKYFNKSKREEVYGFQKIN